MSFYQNWKSINKNIPISKCSAIFNSQRRAFAENQYSEKCIKKTLRATLRVLFSTKISSKNAKMLFFYGGLETKVNAGAMLNKISNHFDMYDYEIWHENDLLIGVKKKYSKLFSIRMILFSKFFIMMLLDLLTHRQTLKLNKKQFITYLFYKSAFIAFLVDTINANRISAFVTYNDILVQSADISIAFRFAKRNVYHIQHGVIGEYNYPGIANYYILWGENSKEKCLSLGYKNSVLHIIGAACFEVGYYSDIDVSKTLLFFSQTGDPQSIYNNYYEEAKNWIKNISIEKNDWKFIIRLHPNEIDSNFYNDIEGLPNVSFQNAIEIPINEAISKATICATIFSGAGLDAMIMKKPLVVFCPESMPIETNWINDGCIAFTNYNELLSFVSNFSILKTNDILSKQKEVLSKEFKKINAIDDIVDFINSKENSSNKLLNKRKLSDIEILKKKLYEKGIISNSSINFNTLPIINKCPNSTFTIGNNCSILNNSDENCAGISSTTVISTVTKDSTLKIGNNVGMSGVVICCSYKITIGNFVNFGVGTRIYDTDFHPFDYIERRKNPGFDLLKIPHEQVSIGDDVWTGANVLILKGVSLGDRVIVAAGSVVTKSFPADSLIGGNPAKLIRILK